MILSNDNNKSSSNTPLFERIAEFIIKSRYIIFLLFFAAVVFCSFSMKWTKVNSDLTSFLSPETETRRGLDIMEEEFTTFQSVRIMVENISYEDAAGMSERMASIDGVSEVAFDNTEEHYKNGSALYSITFGAEDTNPEKTLETIKDELGDYKYYIPMKMGSSFLEKLAGEMVTVVALASAVIVLVLLFTSNSFLEIAIFAIVFVIAAVLNMGTNYWIGEISSITNSVAVILQLALAIDYAIILSHRYYDERKINDSARDALRKALAKSIVEISSSSLTTISGLAALTIMQFRLGYDLGIVLIKGIICSMLTVFLLMPGLIYLMSKPLKVTEHKFLVPRIDAWGRVLTKKVPVFLIVFALLLPLSIYFSGKAEYAFNDSSITELVHSDEREALHKINDTFSPDTSIAVLVPVGSYEKEETLIANAGRLDGIKTAFGIAAVRFGDNLSLTEPYDYHKYSALTGVDESLIRELYTSYARFSFRAKYAEDPEGYEVPLVDMLMFMFRIIDTGIVDLDPVQQRNLDEIRGPIEKGYSQLKGKTMSRIVLTSDILPEDERGVQLVENIRKEADSLYGEGKSVIVGDITSARDLRNSFESDSVLICVLTIVFVFIILLFTFRSTITAAALVFVIQGSIWINFSLQYFMGIRCSFVTYMIVSAIQMGATIDYAIVIMNRYMKARENMEKKDAMIKAVSDSFPTVLTSGAIITVAGMLIGFRVSDVYVGHIGFAVGRGALVSVILVLMVLPQLILILDKVIQKTTFKSPKEFIKNFKPS